MRLSTVFQRSECAGFRYEEPHEQWHNHIVVNCDAGQSLNNAIAKLNKQIPDTVTVQGTCTEYVTIAGFENLTVKSTSGATLVQPGLAPSNLFVTLLRINASRSVTIDGHSFTSDASKPPVIGIGAESIDVRLRNLNIVGGSVGIFAFETSEVSITRVNVKNSGWAYVFAVDGSNVHVEDCLLEDSSGTGWHEDISSENSPCLCASNHDSEHAGWPQCLVWRINRPRRLLSAGWWCE